ncbi:hypothetical protein N7532_005604 [Penicillium argentinense]|uniref:Uncharacterized protein n=1 Tax=Penicillium argentinense TaxID=1131581 RepID=A0A9W9FE76_9EURO|nr:uncharacterized protein N7532_005604 [Penicillium argentinense]KAJ5098603.1 hypothetical protein N7532_005604 [Penicillium argentinense]
MNSVNDITSLHSAQLLPDDSQRHIKTVCGSRAASIEEFRLTVSEVTPENATVCESSSYYRSGFERLDAHVLRQTHHLSLQTRIFFGLSPASIFEIESLDLDIPNWEQKLCYTALAQLYTFFAEAVLEPLTWPVLFTWPVLLSEEFLGLIQQRHSLALVIVVCARLSEFEALAAARLGGAGTVDSEDLDSMIAGVEMKGWAKAQRLQVPHLCRNPLLEGYLRSTITENMEKE